jgi:hypothetical protein
MIVNEFSEQVSLFRIIDEEWEYSKFVILCRTHPFGLKPLGHSSDHGTFLWAKFKTENTLFDFSRNTLQQVKNPENGHNARREA